jgi:FkbM family methyltransferase
MNARRIFECITGYWVHRAGNLPFGTDLRIDLQRICGSISRAAVFDVGANVGQSIPRLRTCFPNSPIYCFEPVNENFKKLKIATRNQTGLVLEKLGLSNTAGTVNINLNSDPTECSMEYSYSDGQSESIKVTTIDQYCHDHSIRHIGFLKIDVEGHEIKTLEGACNLFTTGSIDFVLLETEILPSERHFISAQEFANFLKAHNFSMVAIYDQTHQWNGTRKLQFANALFGRNDVLSK